MKFIIFGVAYSVLIGILGNPLFDAILLRVSKRLYNNTDPLSLELPEFRRALMIATCIGGGVMLAGFVAGVIAVYMLAP